MNRVTETTASVRTIADIGALDYYLHCIVETHCELIDSTLSVASTDVQRDLESMSRSVQFYTVMAHQVISMLIESHSSLDCMSDMLPTETKLRLYMAKYMGLLCFPHAKSKNFHMQQCSLRGLLDSLHCLVNIKRGVSLLFKDRISDELDECLDDLAGAHLYQVYFTACVDSQGEDRPSLFKQTMLCMYNQTDGSATGELSSDEQRIVCSVSSAVRSFAKRWTSSSKRFLEQCAVKAKDALSVDSSCKETLQTSMKTFKQSLLMTLGHFSSVMVPPAAVILARKVHVQKSVSDSIDPSHHSTSRALSNSMSTSHSSIEASPTRSDAAVDRCVADPEIPLCDENAGASETEPNENAGENHQKVSENHQKVSENHQKVSENHQKPSENHQMPSENHQNQQEKSTNNTEQKSKRIKTAEHNMSISNLVAAPEELKEFVAQHGSISPSLFRYHLVSDDDELASIINGDHEEIKEFVQSVQNKDERVFVQPALVSTGSLDQAGHVFSPSSSSKAVRKRIPWSHQEEQNLVKGFNQFGRQWALILQHFEFHPSRDGVSLKDKARILKL